MPINIPCIRAFLNRPGIEGPQQVRGYIPCHWTRGRTRNYTGQPHPEEYTAMGASGVTIGTGVDLGQTNADTLRGAGVADGIVNCLLPYLGLKREAAVRKLHELPLTVSRATADVLDNAVIGLHAGRIAARYNQDSPVAAFADLPPQAQAVIVSLLYQLGCTGGPRRAPHTWAALLAGDWRDAAARLGKGSLWEGYQARRALEGKYLSEAVRRPDGGGFFRTVADGFGKLIGRRAA